MSVSWVGRQILALVLLAVILVGVSSFLGLVGAVRQATRQAEIESQMVTGSVRTELARLATEPGAPGLREVARDPRLQRVLLDAIGLAPSVLHVAILAPGGIVVAHTVPSRIDTVEPPYRPLPEVQNLPGTLRTLWSLARVPTTFQKEVSLAYGNDPYATIRVAIASTFLWDAVQHAAARELRTALVLVTLTVAAGVGLARFATRRFQALERGIAALSEGRVEPVSASGVDEFDRLARGLNLLATRFAVPAAEAAKAESSAEEPVDLAALARQSRAITRLGEVAAGAAHELRNELQAVNLHLEALRQPRGQDSENMAKHANRVAEGIDRLDGAIRGFLTIAGVRPPKPRPIDLNDLLREVRERFASEAMLAGIELGLELAPDLPRVPADPEVLQHALQNLLRNALQAMVDQDDGRIVLFSSSGDDCIRVGVRDNGPGIPEDVRDRVFDLFFTTKAEGSGVGLAVVRQSIELHGGQVAIRSAVGQGTEVTLEVPCPTR